MIVTDYNGANLVSGISQSGANWSRLTGANYNGTLFGTSTELWYAPNVQNAGTAVTINCGISAIIGIAAAVIVEYSGVATTGALDQMATATGSSGTGATGNTATTAQANEVWVGGIGVAANDSSISGLSNGFAEIAGVTQTWSYLIGNYYDTIFAVDKIASSTGQAGCTGTFGSGGWAGAIATLKGSSYYTYTYTYYTTNLSVTLAGPAAGNYTLVYSGTVTINPTNLTVTAAANTKLYDGTTSAAAHPTITAGSIQSGDTAPTWTESYADRNAGTGKTLIPAALLVLDGNYGTNYNYTYAPVPAGVINPTNLTVTATANTKTYDGTTSATNTPTWTGYLQTGDSVGPANFWETYDNPSPGTGKTLTPAGGVSDGNNGLNYSYNYTPVSTGVITPLAIAQQPANLTICSGSPAIFTVDLPPAAGLTYQWQVSTNGGTTFTNISDTATNASYTNLLTTLADNANQYQVIVGEGTTSLTSAPPAVLSVNAPATASAGGNQTICAGSNTAALGGSWAAGPRVASGRRLSGTGAFSPNPNDVTERHLCSVRSRYCGGHASL